MKNSKKYKMKRLNNINKLYEIDNNYRLTITKIKSFKDFNINDIFYITTFIKRCQNLILFYDYMRNEWIFGNRQILDCIDDIYVKYYKYIHYKECYDRTLLYLFNKNYYIYYISFATLIKKSVNNNKDNIYILSIIDNLSNE